MARDAERDEILLIVCPLLMEAGQRSNGACVAPSPLPLHRPLDVPKEGRIAKPLGKIPRRGLDLLHDSLDDEPPRRSKVLPPDQTFVSWP